MELAGLKLSMTSFDIIVDPPAVKDLKKLKKSNPYLFNAFSKEIDHLAFDPFSGKPLTGNKKGCFSLRRNDYRLIYEVYVENKVIHVIQVEHRREVYR